MQPQRAVAALSLLAVLLPADAGAQQGSVQVTGAAQTIAGPPSRILGQQPFEPDFGVSWLQPGTRFGMFQVELHGTRRGELPHLGKAFVAIRDLKYRGATWTIEAGDTYFTSPIGDYRFSNLAAPSLTFAGVSLKSRTPRVTTGLLVGRATAWRNLFGSDADTLDQNLAVGQVGYKASDRLDLSARASRVRTGDLKEFGYTIDASDQGGVAARFIVTPSLHVVGDGSVVSYLRRDATARELDGSAVVGASVLLARGWVQVNASRFSPGELPILSQPLTDRQTFFAAGEYDLAWRLRVFGGWEAFRTNLDPLASSSAGAEPPATTGTRRFGGIRAPVGTQSSVAVRVEEGDRRSRLVGASLARVSDTGVATAEWQSSFGAVSGSARYSRRENVESSNLQGSHTVHDSSGHLFVTVRRGVQLFGNAVATRTTNLAGGGQTYWQFGGGGQAQLPGRSLWFRAEGSTSRHVDRLSDLTLPQEAVNIGLNGEIARHTQLGVFIYADRLAAPAAGDGSWVSRSSVRVTRSFATGSPRTSRSVVGGAGRHGGTGSIAGMVFNDWNANGQQDPGEDPVENIPIRLATLGHATTAARGEFAFLNVPIGLQQVGLDLTALPVDFDPPAVPQVQLELGRGDAKRVAFGLIPLGVVSGRVVLDANENGRADEGEKALDGAVLVLDGGARSEQQRKGRFRFDAVRSGDHTIELVLDSLPDGAAIAGSGSASLPLSLTRDRATVNDVEFLVTIQARPEVRRVFSNAPASAPAGRRTSPARPPASAARSATTVAIPRPALREAAAKDFAIQLAAFDDPLRARALVGELKANGLSAYLIEPPASDLDAPYRVRVGRYATRDDAQKAAGALEKARGGKLWVIREIKAR